MTFAIVYDIELKKIIMKTTLNVFALILVFLVGSSFSTSDHSIKDWKRLGSKKVSYKLDRDVIHVGANDGTFTKLKIQVTGGNVHIHKMVVEYGNGTNDNIVVKHIFKKGSNSRVIDLEGGKRIIKDITFIYDTKNSSKKKGTIHVFGKK